MPRADWGFSYRSDPDLGRSLMHIITIIACLGSIALVLLGAPS